MVNSILMVEQESLPLNDAIGLAITRYKRCVRLPAHRDKAAMGHRFTWLRSSGGWLDRRMGHMPLLILTSLLPVPATPGWPTGSSSVLTPDSRIVRGPFFRLGLVRVHGNSADEALKLFQAFAEDHHSL